jgi:hypothetical protein
MPSAKKHKNVGNIHTKVLPHRFQPEALPITSRVKTLFLIELYKIYNLH